MAADLERPIADLSRPSLDIRINTKATVSDHPTASAHHAPPFPDRFTGRSFCAPTPLLRGCTGQLLGCITDDRHIPRRTDREWDGEMARDSICRASGGTPSIHGPRTHHARGQRDPGCVVVWKRLPAASICAWRARRGRLPLSQCTQEILARIRTCFLYAMQVWRPENTTAGASLPVLFWIHVHFIFLQYNCALKGPRAEHGQLGKIWHLKLVVLTSLQSCLYASI